MLKLSLLSALLCTLSLQGQDKPPVKFGKISAEDFKTIYTIDSNASAVVVADIGSSEITSNLKGWFSIEFRHFKRVHILKEHAFDLADVEILLYRDGTNEEELRSIRAHTYNLDNGKITEAKLEVKSAVYSKAISKNHFSRKFTFPAVKAGSIIEYEYTINSDFVFNLRPWQFQGDYPCLWSEYNVSVPDFLYYVFLQQGDFIKSKRTRRERFSVINTLTAGASSSEPVLADVTEYRMIRKDIPALREESYTTTLNNHVAKIEFQLAEIRPPLDQKKIMGDWADAVYSLMNDEYFGGPLSRDNAWLNEDLRNALQGATEDRTKARNIYSYVQRIFSCTGYDKVYAGQPLKNVLKNRTGSEAEINLILIAMLRKAGLSAHPLLLSTRSHGYAYADHPVMEKFNYVIARLNLDSGVYFLDASRPHLGFGRLHWTCYNGHARVIDDTATAVEFSADSLLETKTTSVMGTVNDKGELLATVQTIPGYYGSLDLRSLISDQGRAVLLEQLRPQAAADVALKNLRLELLENLQESLQISYDIDIKLGTGNVIYFNPMLSGGFHENPFKSVKRLYPVEMPYTIDDTYLFQVGIPDDYEVEFLPNSIRVDLDDEGKSFFEYLITNSKGVISLRSRVKLMRTYFLPQEYELLRDFFKIIADRHSAQIILKKRKPGGP